jgi:hypothetical protein
VFSAHRTDTDFQAWRDQPDWTERKYAMWKRREASIADTTAMMGVPVARDSTATIHLAAMFTGDILCRRSDAKPAAAPERSVKDYQVSIALRDCRLPCLRSPVLAPASALINTVRLIGSRIQNGCFQRRSPTALRALNFSGMS